MGMDSVAVKQLHLDVHDLVNVTWGLVVVVHVELVFWITDTDTVCRINQIILSACLLYTSPSPRDGLLSRMPSSA